MSELKKGLREGIKDVDPRDSGETFKQFTSRLKSHFTRWIDMSGINKTYEGLADLILRSTCFYL